VNPTILSSAVEVAGSSLMFHYYTMGGFIQFTDGCDDERNLL